LTDMLVFDAHCDAPSQMLRLRDYSLDNHHAQVDFPKMKRGGVLSSFFALYIPAICRNPREYMESLLKSCMEQLDANPDKALLTCSSAQLKNNFDKGLISIWLGLENGSPIADDLSYIQELYNKGIRYITLTHSADNQICDSCTGIQHWGGLSPFGREVVKEMNRVGMMIDLAHCSNNTVKDVLDISDKPVAFTHGCCSSLCNHKRNLPDDLLRAIAQNGGVVGISHYPLFMTNEFARVLEESGLEKNNAEDLFISDPSNAQYKKDWNELQDQLSSLTRPGIDLYAKHICHAVDVCGIDHVSLGTDYDGIEVTAQGLETIECLPLVFNELDMLGFTDVEKSKIASENLVRVLDKVAAK